MDSQSGANMARRKEAHGGGHGWFVTFADLMGLLVSFFVMLVAFSNQDSKKVQAVAGSMRDAFGVQTSARYSGIVESDGLPTRSYLKNAAHIQPKDSSVTPTRDEAGSSVESGQKSSSQGDRTFALAAASLRQALQDLPELTQASKHIMVEETKEGLNINVVDQDGSSMFPKGSKEPYDRTRDIFQKIAGLLKATPYRISITGHTSSAEVPLQSDYGLWNLSVDRASTVRQILEEQGYPTANIFKVAGRASNDPLFPEDVSKAPNRRVTITLIHEAPPVPADLQP
jgi:chemotaxis protein MotB